MAGVSAARTRRERPPDNSAAPESFKNCRRRTLITEILARQTASVNFHILPALFLAGRLEDRCLGQRLGFLGLRYRPVEIAAVARLLRCRQRGLGGKPLIAQSARLLFCRFGRSI